MSIDQQATAHDAFKALVNLSDSSLLAPSLCEPLFLGFLVSYIYVSPIFAKASRHPHPPAASSIPTLGLGMYAPLQRNLSTVCMPRSAQSLYRSSPRHFSRRHYNQFIPISITLSDISTTEPFPDRKTAERTGSFATNRCFLWISHSQRRTRRTKGQTSFSGHGICQCQRCRYSDSLLFPRS